MLIFLSLLGIITSGLFSGLMMTLVFVLQKQWNTMNQKDYSAYFKQFLLVAKGNSLITFLTLYSFLFPIVVGSIFMIRNDILIGIPLLISGIIFLCGCFVVTMKLNFPIYNTVIEWKSESDAIDWINIRNRFHKLNILRFLCSFTTFIILLITLTFRNFT